MWGKIVTVIIVAAIIIICIEFRSRCPKCKKHNTMKERKRKEVSRSKQSKRLYDGKKRYYTLVKYEVTYECENCGATEVRYEQREEN